jgi:hypothetical protein
MIVSTAAKAQYCSTSTEYYSIVSTAVQALQQKHRILLYSKYCSTSTEYYSIVSTYCSTSTEYYSIVSTAAKAQNITLETMSLTYPQRLKSSGAISGECRGHRIVPSCQTQC